MSRILFYLMAVFHLTAGSLFSQWIQQDSPTSKDIKKIQFLNADTGYMLNDFWNQTQVIYRTTNAGLSWDSTEINDAVNGMFFLNENTGWLTGRTTETPGFGKIWKTTDGSQTWSSYTLRDSLNGFSVYFSDLNTGFITANNYSYTNPSLNLPAIFRTTNGGQNWVEITGFLTDCKNIFNIFFINNNTGWFTVVKGEGNNARNVIFKTTDSGLNWTSYGFPDFFGGQYANLRNVQFLNANTGFVSGNVDVWYNGGVPFPKFLRTTNGGLNWNDAAIPEIPPYLNYASGMYFSNSDTGWIAGNRGNIMITTNNGQNWSNQITGIPTNIQFWDMDFNSGNIWVVGRNGVILKTTNGGFSPQFTITGTVKYQDNNQPVTSGYVKAIKHTAIPGNLITLDSVPINTDGTYRLLHVPQDTIDLMAFDDDEIDIPTFVPTYYPSTILWEQAQQIIPSSNLTGIDIGAFRITNDLQSSGKISGGVYLNTDMPVLTGIGNAIIYAKIGNLFKGYSISGNNGTYSIDSLPRGYYQLICNRPGYPTRTRFEILRRVNLTNINFIYGGTLVSINEPNSIPEGFILKQNYPNPFNPVTKFRFGIPANKHVKLAVYDVLGKEISLLVSGDLEASYYDITWDAVSYPSGVYFYRLEAGDYAETKKMVLLK